MDREPDRFDDERLARLLGASRAPRDAATLTRALARLRAAEREPAWLAWLARPAALVAAASLLVVSLGAGAWYGRGTTLTDDTPAGTTTTTTTGTDLLGSLLVEESATGSATSGVADSGGVQ